ncbi:integrative conjugative element protein, RAQPRD family [Burkholderia pseudomallei]|uniref:integrative conjugative element protein, RAQPRD family n=1 Tax=Burkholderia pseudomallei TaxID=28450 RepID=UPI000F08D43D|nr:RAQPRD family integrative conjugative element protein [Burkholderia pseudomallei]VBI73304.1 integrative conjugative element protein, RAQPRD family [Burkholderia pseudomallei]
MTSSSTTIAGTVRLVTIALALGVAYPACATQGDRESTDLAAIERQLDTIDRLATQSEQLPDSDSTHAHFDYTRLHADIARVREGIQDYLSPHRSLSRDPSTLVGHYRVRADAP